MDGMSPSLLAAAAWTLFLNMASVARAGDPPYAALFDDTRVHAITVTLSAAAAESLREDPTAWVRADVEIDGAVVHAVGVRHKGNSSMGIGTPKLPLKIDFGEFTKDQSFHGLKMLVLNNNFKDPSMLREKLAYDLFRELGAPASRCAHARVVLEVTGAPPTEGSASPAPKRIDLGLYTMVEHVDEVFLNERFGTHEGNLYKLEMDPFQTRGPAMGPPGASRSVELKTNETTNDRSRLDALVRAVAEASADLSVMVDFPSFARYTALCSALANLDSPVGTGHNAYLYDDPKTGKFVIVPWDLNEAFGNFQMGPANELLDWSIAKPYAGRKPLFERLMGDARFAELYRTELRRFIDGPFNPARMNARIDELAKVIRKDAGSDTNTRRAPDEWARSLTTDSSPPNGPGARGQQARGPNPMLSTVLGLKPFVSRRAESIKTQLDGKSTGKVIEGRLGGPGGPPRPRGQGGPGGPPGGPPVPGD